MNKEQYEKEVKKILHREPSEKVDKFLLYFDYEGQLKMVNTINRSLKELTDKNYANDAVKCLKYLKRINNNYMIPSNQKNNFTDVIGWLEDVVSLNTGIRTIGRPGKLSETDFIQLEKLRYLFKIFFPEKSSKFTKGNLICQLGELLLGKSLPKLIDQQLAERSSS